MNDLQFVLMGDCVSTRVVVAVADTALLKTLY